jgi:putative transposase
MKKARRTTEKIIRILRDSEGLSVNEACRRYEISATTYHLWKAEYGGMGIKEAQRLRDIQKGNSELEKLQAEQMLNSTALEIALEKTSEPGASASYGSEDSGDAVMFRAKCLSLVGIEPQHTALRSQGSAEQEEAA